MEMVLFNDVLSNLGLSHRISFPRKAQKAVVTLALVHSGEREREDCFSFLNSPSKELLPVSRSRKVKGMWTRVIFSFGTWMVAFIDDIDD
jgi:hypothetical protein